MPVHSKYDRHLSRFLSIAAMLATSWCVASAVASPNAQLGTEAPPSGTSSQTISFTDASSDSGLDFLHFNGMSGRLYYPEVVGSGGALFDYDNDGDLDVYFVQGNMLGNDLSPREAVFPWPGEVPARDRLFRNDWFADHNESPRRAIHFTDVTATSGILAAGYGMGVAAGDYDNDGFVDLYVLNFGRNELWRNRGDGTFEETAARAGVDDARWSTSASFNDYDQDGDLDLFVVNYIEFSLLHNKQCLTERGEPDYCLPNSYRPSTDALFRNRGDGTFEDVSASSGIGQRAANGLGVVSGDFDGDGALDFYVANDLMANHLWLNQGDGTFREDALLAGAALSRDGKAEASMGIAAGDFDGDFDLDLFLTHFNREKNTLYVQGRPGEYADETARFGLATPSFPFTAFGTAFADFDRDGDLDLFAANGAVVFPPGVDRTKRPFPFDETNQVFCNLAGTAFADCTATAGAALRLSAVSRGALAGDLDNDGDLDLLITNNSSHPQLLVNESAPVGGWLGIDLVTSSPSGSPGAAGPAGRWRSAYGATARLSGEVSAPLSDQSPAASPGGTGRPPDPWKQWRFVQSDGGYASARDPRILFAVAPSLPGTLTVEVQWPSGGRERFSGLAPGRYHRLYRTTGTAVSERSEP